MLFSPVKQSWHFSVPHEAGWGGSVPRVKHGKVNYPGSHRGKPRGLKLEPEPNLKYWIHCAKRLNIQTVAKPSTTIELWPVTSAAIRLEHSGPARGQWVPASLTVVPTPTQDQQRKSNILPKPVTCDDLLLVSPPPPSPRQQPPIRVNHSPFFTLKKNSSACL